MLSVCNKLLSLSLNIFFMPERGLEPPRTCAHQNLNLARLPIPPPGLGILKQEIFYTAGGFFATPDNFSRLSACKVKIFIS